MGAEQARAEALRDDAVADGQLPDPKLSERSVLYENSLLRDAKANAEASLSAYQSGVTEFTTLMRARLTELDVRLEDLRVRVDRAKTQARLLYLAAGEKP